MSALFFRGDKFVGNPVYIEQYGSPADVSDKAIDLLSTILYKVLLHPRD